VISQGVRIADINSEVQMLSSQAMIEMVVDQLGPDAFKSVLVPPDSWLAYPKYILKRVAREGKAIYKETLILLNLKKRLTPRQEAVLAVTYGVHVEPVKDSDILVLQVRMPAPALAVEVSNALLEAYLRRRIEVRQPQAGSEFFRARLDEAHKRLLDVEAQRAEVREQNQITSADEQRTAALRQLSTLRGELLENETERAGLVRQRDLMAERAAGLAAFDPKEQVESRNPSITPLEERLAQLRVEEAKLGTRYNESSETIAKIKTEIASLEAAIKQQPARVLSSVTSENSTLRREFLAGVEQQTVRISGLDSRNAYLRPAIDALQEEVLGLSHGADDVQAVDREYLRAEQDYLFYAKRLEEAHMSEQLDRQRAANVAIVAPPDTPIEPVSPRKLFLLGIAMAVSLMLGVALAAVIETIEDRILDEQSVAAIGDVPYLGTVTLPGRA
jgi:uncharacterized protein involved in exopolysaccharide biosynthesis